MKPILQTLTWFTLCSKKVDVNPSAELEGNSGKKEKEVRRS